MAEPHVNWHADLPAHRLARPAAHFDHYLDDLAGHQFTVNGAGRVFLADAGVERFEAARFEAHRAPFDDVSSTRVKGRPRACVSSKKEPNRSQRGDADEVGLFEDLRDVRAQWLISTQALTMARDLRLSRARILAEVEAQLDALGVA